MTRSIRRRVVALAALLSALSSVAVATERSEVPAKLTWDLTALYPSEDAWNAAREDITRRNPTLASFQGHLGAAPESLYTAVSTMMGVNRDLAQLFTYASQLNDQDQRVRKQLFSEDRGPRVGLSPCR
jgi:oligoendopeptidase F